MNRCIRSVTGVVTTAALSLAMLGLLVAHNIKNSIVNRLRLEK